MSLRRVEKLSVRNDAKGRSRIQTHPCGAAENTNID